MRTHLLLAAVVTPLVLFASCASGPAATSSTTTTAASSSSTGSAGGNGGAGGTSLVSGSGTFTTGSGGGCGTSDAGADASTGCDGLDGGVTFSGDVFPIFMASCNGEVCHNTPTYAGLVNVPAPECCDDGELFVKPGDADHSYLMNKLTGHALCYGAPMPFGEPPLPDAEILTIRTWICEGAPND
jgi:hypothetical protein